MLGSSKNGRKISSIHMAVPSAVHTVATQQIINQNERATKVMLHSEENNFKVQTTECKCIVNG
jgi:hypothetical protein